MALPAVCLLLAALRAAGAEVKYFQAGGQLRLRPDAPPEGISSITWKHQGNLVAEWMEGGEVEYFGDFKGRTTLILPSGELSITALSSDRGDFTVEVNNRVQGLRYSAQELRGLGSVEVVVRPLTCSHQSPACNLSCLTDTEGLGPLRYFWREEHGPWTESSKDRGVTNNDRAKVFFCKVKNPVSEKESGRLDNPFTKLAEPAGALVSGLVVLLLLLVLGGAALWVFAYKYPQKLAPCFPCIAADRTERSTKGHQKPEDSSASVALTHKTHSPDTPAVGAV